MWVESVRSKSMQAMVFTSQHPNQKQGTQGAMEVPRNTFYPNNLDEGMGQ